MNNAYLSSVIKQRKESRSDNTIKLYLKNLNKIMTDLNFGEVSSLDFLHEVEMIDKYIDGLNTNSL